VDAAKRGRAGGNELRSAEVRSLEEGQATANARDAKDSGRDDTVEGKLMNCKMKEFGSVDVE
jgi:hypothetical protein